MENDINFDSSFYLEAESDMENNKSFGVDSNCTSQISRFNEKNKKSQSPKSFILDDEQTEEELNFSKSFSKLKKFKEYINPKKQMKKQKNQSLSKKFQSRKTFSDLKIPINDKDYRLIFLFMLY